MTFKLEQLGPFRVEQTEDYKAKSHDNSYAEMIRVRGSKPKQPYFDVLSHVYKFSEKELGIYLKDHKNLWRQLGKLLNERIDISDEELMVHFSASLFPKIAKIVPFIRKRGLSGKSELAKTIGMNTQFARDTRHKMSENALNFSESVHEGNLMQLNVMNSKEGPK